MLTVRIFHNDGTETIQEAKSVRYVPTSEEQVAHLNIFPITETVPMVIVDGATVYVMNEDGKTIADYHI